MGSKKQIEANRNNSKRFTGPRTEQGKQRSPQNALKHGLLAERTVIPGEDPAEYDALLTQYEEAFEPSNPVEASLVRQVADAKWRMRMRRIAGLEAAFLSYAVEERRRYRAECYSEEGVRTDKFLLGEIMQSRANCLSHFARYDAHFSRRYFQAIKQLAQLRELQHGAARRQAQDAHERPPQQSPPQQSTRKQSQKERYWPAQAPDPPPLGSKRFYETKPIQRNPHTNNNFQPPTKP